MNVHAARNPTGWYGHTPYYGVIINAHDAHYPRVVAWWSMDDDTATHRGYTFDSPGLPTIGGYPGEQGGGNATPLGGCTFFLCAIKCIACNYPWRRIIMIYMVTKTKMNGEIARGILKSTTPKGVGFRVGFIKTG